jgi:integrating conjugative element protein (TIGR03746 family)
MHRYRYEIDNVRSHLRSLWSVIVLQLLIIGGLWIGWMRMPATITVHIPPDLRSGAVMTLDEVPATNVYAFAFYIFQQLNRWSENGAEDYGKAIYRIRRNIRHCPLRRCSVVVMA